MNKEQQTAWDRLKGPGLYRAEGSDGYEEVLTRTALHLGDPSDPHTVLLIGKEKDVVPYLERMTKRGIIDGPAFCEPNFFWFQDYAAEDYDPEDMELDHRSLRSELDAERFRNFISTSVERQYYPIKSVVVFDCGLYENPEQGELKYLDRILEVPVMRGKYKDKVIHPEVYHVFTYQSDESSFTKLSGDGKGSSVQATVEVIHGEDVQPEVIPWLMPGFIPLHQSTAFSGEMDCKKSTTLINIGAAYSCWHSWFDGTPNEHNPQSTLMLAAEDNIANTIMPRWLAAGGQPHCIGFLKLDVTCKQETKDGPIEYSTPLSLDEHLNKIYEAILQENKTRPWKVGLLGCDPIISFFGGKDYNNSQDARDIMRGMKRLCEELQITNVNITHFNKTLGLGSKQKTAGAKALIEAHRQAWAFDNMEDDPKMTLVAPVKANLLANAKSYKITTISKDVVWNGEKHNVGVIKFVGHSEMTADERIEEKESKNRGSRKKIKDAIRDELKNGPLPAGQVCNALQDLGVPRSIRRAAEELEEEGKLLRVGPNNKNLVWQLVIEFQQASFDKEAVQQ
jgi:hypothetical protein